MSVIEKPSVTCSTTRPKTIAAHSLRAAHPHEERDHEQRERDQRDDARRRRRRGSGTRARRRRPPGSSPAGPCRRRRPPRRGSACRRTRTRSPRPGRRRPPATVQARTGVELAHDAFSFVRRRSRHPLARHFVAAPVAGTRRTGCRMAARRTADGGQPLRDAGGDPSPDGRREADHGSCGPQVGVARGTRRRSARRRSSMS